MEIKDILNFNRGEFYSNPHNCFNYPPPNFDHTDDAGWTTLAKAIVGDDGGLKRYVSYAKKWKEKEHEWNSVS